MNRNKTSETAHRGTCGESFSTEKAVRNRSVGGRPALANRHKLSIPVTVKFDIASHERLKLRSRKSGKRLSAYIREAALQGEVVMPKPACDIQAYRSLAGLANNLNQLARLAHQTVGNPLAMYRLSSQISDLLTEIRPLISEIRKGNAS